MEQNKRKPNPIEKANPFSVLTLMYMFPIFKKSYKKRGFTEDDLFEPLDEHKSSILGKKLERIWKKEQTQHRKAALHIALFKMFGLQFVLLGVVKLFDEIMLVVVQPLAIGRLVLYFQSNGTDKPSDTEAYIAACVIVACLVIDAFVAHPSMMGLMHIAMKLRVSCSALIYRKTLRLSRKALGQTTIGQLVNLLSNDVSKFDQGFLLCHFVWVGPIQTAVGTYMLYRTIGVSAFFGMAFLLSFIPLQIFLGKRTSVLRLRTALRTDERVRLMNEVISGIQVIKMYTWEKPFSKLISFCRRREVSSIRQHRYLLGTIFSFESFVTRTSIFISILGFVLQGNILTAQVAFSVAAVYTALNPVITILFSISISSLAEVNVSIKRMQKFLNSEEVGETKAVDKALDRRTLLINGMDEKVFHSIPKVVLENVCAKWTQEANGDTLKDISVSVTKSQLVAVIGPVGSGKSSLFHVILKELPTVSGNIRVDGELSYSSQEAWLFNGSVRQNIMFGEEYDEERYKEVVKVCALESDFDLFPFGDRTLVGEKGKALSGGQKARINLARCIYRKADIYLLDDPLSAVDAKVGKQLYEQCIKRFLKDKICILSTHQLQYLTNADSIIILKDGKIELQGTYQELQTSGLDFAKLLHEFNVVEEEDSEKQKVKSRQNSETVEDVTQNEDEETPKIEKELVERGTIKAKVYGEYFKSGGNWLMILTLVLSFLMSQSSANGGEYFLSYWVNQQQEISTRIANNISLENDTVNQELMVYIYSGLTLTTIVLSLVHSIYFFIFCLMASVHLHDYVFSKVIGASMRFFNSNPSGRILNRFSKDLGIIDEYIPNVLFDVIEVALLLTGAIILSCTVNPWLAVPSLTLMAIFYCLRRIYLQTSRSVKRIEGIKRSPIFSQMSTTMHGLTTIRAFKAEEMLIQEFDCTQDSHSSAWFIFIASSRAFGFWLDTLCIIFIAGVVFSLLTFNKSLYGGDIGLVITQYFGLMGSLQWGMRQWSELENQMTSVERLLEYTKVESEPDKRKAIKTVTKNWPEYGKIEFCRVAMRYTSTDPYVLKNLNFTIHPKEKIGVVGRTGAGKSSMIASLFHLYEIEGSILIDDVDTRMLSLEMVRSKISIIPQEPVLFSGTMRKNLDPFDEYSDDILWNALKEVELKDVISDLPCGLNTTVSEGGSNYSIGQRQLVCLARAIIRNNKILVMDEATANVDPRTDGLIQTTIRTKFADCTVLTIAHRLHTVMDSDRILVMNAGCVEEFDHPAVLLKNESSFLFGLVQTTGKAMAKNLQEIAEQSYLRRKHQ